MAISSSRPYFQGLPTNKPQRKPIHFGVQNRVQNPNPDAPANNAAQRRCPSGQDLKIAAAHAAVPFATAGYLMAQATNSLYPNPKCGDSTFDSAVAWG